MQKKLILAAMAFMSLQGMGKTTHIELMPKKEKGSSDISRDSLLKKKTAAQIVYLNKHKQTYNYEQQFSISCVGSIHPPMYS